MGPNEIWAWVAAVLDAKEPALPTPLGATGGPHLPGASHTLRPPTPVTFRAHTTQFMCLCALPCGQSAQRCQGPVCPGDLAPPHNYAWEWSYHHRILETEKPRHRTVRVAEGATWVAETELGSGLADPFQRRCLPAFLVLCGAAAGVGLRGCFSGAAVVLAHPPSRSRTPLRLVDSSHYGSGALAEAGSFCSAHFTDGEIAAPHGEAA